MNTDDDDTIQAIIERQFGSLDWNSATPANWRAFAGDFLPDASLYPAARPAKSQTPEEFVDRMKGLAATELQTFNEVPLGCDIHVFGNVAVAAAACEITENETTVTRSVEMMLLVKNDGRWQIVSQAWDNESDFKPIPADLLKSR
jgi:ketosteroid isomerase-like protein